MGGLAAGLGCLAPIGLVTRLRMIRTSPHGPHQLVRSAAQSYETVLFDHASSL